MAKCSCWSCGAKDEYCYHVEPIVEGTNAGGYMNAASTPELANLGHLVYQPKNVSYEGAPHGKPSLLDLNFFLTKFNFFQYQNRIYIVRFTSSDGSKEFRVAGRIRGQ